MAQAVDGLGGHCAAILPYPVFIKQRAQRRMGRLSLERNQQQQFTLQRTQQNNGLAAFQAQLLKDMQGAFTFRGQQCIHPVERREVRGVINGLLDAGECQFAIRPEQGESVQRLCQRQEVTLIAVAEQLICRIIPLKVVLLLRPPILADAPAQVSDR